MIDHDTILREARLRVQLAERAAARRRAAVPIAHVRAPSARVWRARGLLALTALLLGWGGARLP